MEEPTTPDIDSRLIEELKARSADDLRTIAAYCEELADSRQPLSPLPLTPIDLINYGTFDITTAAYIWLLIDKDHTVVVSSESSSTRTDLINSLSMFISSNQRIISIEETHELELPFSHWVPRITSDEDDAHDYTKSDRLESTLRENPYHIVIDEVSDIGDHLSEAIRRSRSILASVDASDLDEAVDKLPPNTESTAVGPDVVLYQDELDDDSQPAHIIEQKYEITDPINSSVSIDSETVQSPVGGTKPYRMARKDDHSIDINSILLMKFKEQYGWSKEELKHELRRREVVLAHLVENRVNSYQEVVAVLNSYSCVPDKTIHHILENSGEDIVEISKSDPFVDLDINSKREEKTDRPHFSSGVGTRADEIISNADEDLHSHDN